MSRPAAADPGSGAGPVPPVPTGPWFNEVAAFLGAAYWAPGTGRVAAFTRGTDQEVAFLVEALALAPGQRVLDVGCGPGRHALALAARGLRVTGVDASPEFVALAAAAAAREGRSARFEVLDVRGLAADAEFDAAVCLCQGGFGLLGGRDDLDVFGRIVRAVRPGGSLAVSACSLVFAARHLEPGETLDAATGVVHERTTLRNEAGDERTADLWTTCFTARELELLAERCGVEVLAVHGVTPGRYRAAPPDLEQPELLLLARRRA
ncbi:MAG TPA: class I SAM-dependent methyltransferase [Acidimicrobiia bacterium]|nr:class I SAM-dependent methyltransferase [Acidimicrobiia bacterium]